MKKDKIYHLVAGMIISVIAGFITVKLTKIDFLFFSGFVASIIAGISKEYIWDKFLKKGEFENADIVFTAIGGALGLTVLTIIL
jgi:hypothetical protein